MKRDGLAELVDGFGRTADAPFVLDELLGFLEERTGKAVDDREVFELAASSCYLFESWNDPLATRFIPRRRFFQGAEFLITPMKEEVQGGFLFPGHRFMPFICRDVFPADAWLLLDDGTAPHVKRIDFPRALADETLIFYGKTHALGYLESDHPANAKAVDTVSVSVFDLRDFYLKNEFRPGDSIRVKVLDWLQGVLSLSYVPSGIRAEHSMAWTAAMRAACGRMQAELGSVGDCYEQLSIMMLLGAEEGDCPLMKDPPFALDTFIESQPDLMIQEVGDRAVLRSVEATPPPADLDAGDLEAVNTPLDTLFKKLGFSITEAEAEAYMRDALYRNAGGSDSVLVRIFAGHSLIFRSPGEQEEFHRLWDELWTEVVGGYSRKADIHGNRRSELLLLKDRCTAVARTLDAETADPEELVKKPGLREFGMLSASLSGVLVLLNVDTEDWVSPAGHLDAITAVIFSELPKVLDTITG